MGSLTSLVARDAEASMALFSSGSQSLDLSKIESLADLLKAMTEGDGRTLTARGGTFDASSRGKSTYPLRWTGYGQA